MPVALDWLAYQDVKPETPGVVKDTVEYTLQGIGVIAVIAVFGFLIWISRVSEIFTRRHDRR